MRLVNELRNIRLQAGAGRSLEAVVRVRGIDARLDNRRGFVCGNHEPVALVVHGQQTFRRVSFPARENSRAALLFIALPVAAYIVARLVTGRRE